MSFSDTNWSQRSRQHDSVRSLHNRISLLSTHSPIDDTINTQYNKTLSKIIDRFNIFTETNTPQEQQKQIEKLLERFGRILSSQREPSIKEDENDIAQSIHKKLQEDQGSEVAFRFGHLYNKLASRQRASKKWSILYLLSLLSANTDDLSSLDSPHGLQNIDQDVNFLQPPTSRPYEVEESPRNTRRKLTQRTSQMEAPPATLLARARERDRPEQVPVPESSLLRDLIFLFQGIDGQYIRYDPSINDHIIMPTVEITKSTKEMVFKLAEIGWLYMKVRTFVKDSMNSPSLVAQSLCAAIQKELTEYYKLIAILEAQIEKQIKSPAITDQSLTLKRLVVWTLDCNKKLRLMSVLADVCQDQKGGALLSVIHNYTKHGDPFIKKYLVDMLQTVSKPFYEMLERWVYEGELDDPYGEFFVACDPTVSEEELWQSKYTLREDMLPTFMSKELAYKIFSIGKSLNFIRYSCHDDTLTQQYHLQTAPEELPKQTFKYGEMELVGKTIEEMYINTSRSLLHLLKKKYKLMDHLKALKRYLLLGQGDFIQYLMDILWVNLSKPASTLFRHNLTGILESAIRSSDAQYHDPEIINRLDVRLLEIQKDDLGWDVFSLEYHVDAPINTVFNPANMQQYFKVFTFLWRIKRVEYTLSLAWRQWGKANRDFVDFKQDTQYAQLTIQRMIHFIYQLQHYVLFEVLECSWDKLETFIENKSIDLDSIIDAHSKYLAEITEKGFLSGHKGETLAGRLSNIFDCVLQYNVVLETLYKYVLNGRQDPEKLDKLRKHHQEMEDDFTLQVLEFLKILKSYHDEDLRSLSTRLDYNDFYTRFDH